MKNGFTIIETLIVLVIVGILAAISYPIYTNHLTKAKRVEAAITLQKLASAMENYFTLHNSYQDVTLETLNFPQKTAENSYQIEITAATDSTFLLQATPAHEDECGALTVNELGQKGITGKSNIDECW